LVSNMINIARVVGVVAVGILSSNMASASLVSETTLAFGGAGLGSATTILTIHDTGPVDPLGERGCQAWSAGGVVLGSTACTSTMEALGGGSESSASNSPTRTLANNLFDVAPGVPAGSGDFIDIRNADQIRIVFNASESGSDNDVRLNDLVLKVYDTGGGLVWNSGAFVGTHSDGTGICAGGVNTMYDCFDVLLGGGIGGAGLVYKLDAAQVADLNSTIFFNPTHIGGNPLAPIYLNYHVALDAAVTSHSGGQETFFLFAREDLFGIPEPSTWFSLGSGLLLLAALSRKRFQKV